MPKRLIGDCVDGEVASSQIVIERDAELDHCVPTIGGNVPPKSGDLVQYPIAVEHAHGSILDANSHGPGKESLHLLRSGRSGNIEIGLGMAQQTVTQTASYAPGLEPGVLQAARDMQNGLRDLQDGGKITLAAVRVARRDRDHQLHSSL